MAARLESGAFAPNFKTIAFGGRVIDTSTMRGQKIWLLFYRYAECPLCCLHLKGVVKNEAAILGRNTQLIVVFESAPGLVTQSVCGKSHAHFPMVADPHKKLYELYGTETKLSAVFRPSVLFNLIKAGLSGFRQGRVEGDLRQVPASFLIDEWGIVQTAYYGKTIADHIPWETVKAFCERPTITNFRALDRPEPRMNDTVSVLIESSENADGTTKKTATDVWKRFGNR